jgi:tRNA (mo5U34)-methyltransferase
MSALVEIALKSPLVARAKLLLKRIEEAKAGIGEVPYEWYPYDNMGNVAYIEALSQYAGLTLEGMAAGQPLLDIGCADGDLSFFLESLGYPVTAIDHAPTNANDLRGVRALKQALGSSIEIVDTDLDRGFTAPHGRYGIVILLGILYHLKNPYLMLETLAGLADYCVISTRIARFAPDGARLHGMPVAYLLDKDEANNDPTNFWIFSEEGLRRLIHRSGWEVRASLLSGNTTNSDPVTAKGDGRMFCLLSRQTLFTNGRLLSGWYEPEDGRDAWRWTAERFAVEFAAIAGTEQQHIEMRLFVPEDRTVELQASVDGVAVASTVLDKPGQQQWTFPVRPPANARRMTVAFTAMPINKNTVADGRSLGVVVSEIKLRGAEARVPDA